MFFTKDGWNCTVQERLQHFTHDRSERLAKYESEREERLVVHENHKKEVVIASLEAASGIP